MSYEDNLPEPEEAAEANWQRHREAVLKEAGLWEEYGDAEGGEA